MTTAGQDFFDENFFDTQIVALVDFPLEKLKYYSTISDDAIAEWESQNQVTDRDKDIARKMLAEWSSEVLSLPFVGEHKIKHYFEKVLWLIQSYCERGWINPLKGINHLDTGQIVVHPGTNRCVAAKFLKCRDLKILINVHKDQTLLFQLENPVLIDNEQDLRATLTSSEKILWRTESREELWIAGSHQTGKTYPDFTYEFLGRDAWPEWEKFDLWTNTIFKFLPLNIYASKDITVQSPILNKTFKDRSQDNLEKLFEYKILSVNDIDRSRPYIYVNRPLTDFDIFELLFFVSVNHQFSRTIDDTIIIHNPYALTNRELIIPEHYVNF
jgi:hypothetical protein